MSQPEAPIPATRAYPGVQRWVALLVLLHFGLGLLYDRATPVFEAPDESFHFAVIRALARGEGLPVQDPAHPGPWEQEGSQPPLYYALMQTLAGDLPTPDWEAATVKNPFLRHAPGDPHNVNAYRHPLTGGPPYTGTALAVHRLRWLSLALSSVTVVLVYRLALAAAGDAWLAVLAAALAGLNPQVLFINAAVNNDTLLTLLCTAALWILLALLARPDRHRLWRSTLAGVLLGLAALTKVSGLVLWPVAALVVLAAAWRAGVVGGRRGPFAAAVGQLLVMFTVAVAICGWWYWRNFQLYGDWSGLNTMIAMAGPRDPAISLAALLREEWYGFYLSAWAVFGVFSILPAAWVHTFYGLLTAFGLAGAVLALLRRPIRPSPPIALLALYALLTVAGIVRWSQQTPASQGRLMFGALGALATLLAAGLLSAARPGLRLRAGRGWAGGFVLTLSAALALVAAIIPPAFIAPRYAGPTPTPPEALPADFQPLRAVYGGQIELLGYASQAQPVRPGESFTVTLFFRARQPIPTDLALALHVLGRGGTEEVSKLDTWPGGGNGATSQWTPGVIYADTYLLPVARTAGWPSLLWLTVDFWDQDPAEKLAISTDLGETLAEVKFPVGRVNRLEILQPEPPVPHETTFDHGITLVGYAAAPNTAANTDALSLTLYWHLDAAVPPPAVAYTVFLHLTNDQDLLVAEPADSPPVSGDWPTTAWLPGTTITDTHRLALPPDLAPGRYDLRLGLYDAATGARLPAFRPDGTRWAEDTVVLEGLVTR
ncbi:MAG: glycosyltransferase family 39 protein [Anaerolineales bacterium]|nr:glycosyltransferase family 39 protein [Anaerolineales bacterium]